jgi:hypothetical protein
MAPTVVKRRQARYEAEVARRAGKAARTPGKGKAPPVDAPASADDDAELERLTAPAPGGTPSAAGKK